MTTEENILQVARTAFYQKGLAGARMQEIADAAGINKAMLHYYYKTKEQLFQAVFTQAFNLFAGRIGEILNSEAALEEKITDYVHHTIDTLQANPGLALFVLNELNTNPERLTGLFTRAHGVSIDRFGKQVKRHSQARLAAENLFADMLALCIYPFIAGPVLGRILHMNTKEYDAFIEQRKKYVTAELLKKL